MCFSSNASTRKHTAISENLLFLINPVLYATSNLLQILNLRHGLRLIGILHHHTLRVEFDNEVCGLDILPSSIAF